FGVALLFFIAVAGADAVVRDGHVLLTGLPEETRRFLLAYSGIGNWRVGILELIYSAGMWLALFLGIELVSARRPGDPWPAGRVGALLGLLAVLGILALAGGGAGAGLFLAGPLFPLAAVRARLEMRPGRRSAALSAFGLAGLVLSYRRPFHIGDAAYVAPALLFALVCAAGLLRLAVLRQRTRFLRARLSTALAGGVALLAALAF